MKELQFLNQGNQLNSSSVAGGFEREESSSPAFASYMSRETESFQKHSSMTAKDKSIHTDTQRTEEYKDLNKYKTSSDHSLDQRNTKVQKSGGSQSKEIHQHIDEPQESDLDVNDNSAGVDGDQKLNTERGASSTEEGTINDNSAGVDGDQKVNTEVRDASLNDEGTITSEAPSGEIAEENTEDTSETIGTNMVAAQQVPNTAIITEGDIKEIEGSVGKAELKNASGTSVTGLSDSKVEGTSEGEYGNTELQTDIDELMPEEEQLIEEQINMEDTDQEGIDMEDTLKTSAEDNNDDGDVGSGTDNEEEVHYENYMSDKDNGQRQNHEKSGHKNPALETAQAVKDNVKPEVADDSEGIHALNKNIKEMIHRHSVTGSSEMKAGASMQAAVETETGMMHTVTNSADIASMSRTADSQMLASVNRPAGIAEVLDSIVYAAKGNNRLGVTIEHSELGKLNINLSLDKGNVHVNIHAADKATKEIIENNIQYIIDSLEKEGVSIGGFSVGMKDYQGKMFQAMLNGNGNRKEFNENVKNADISNGLVSVFA